MAKLPKKMQRLTEIGLPVRAQVGLRHSVRFGNIEDLRKSLDMPDWRISRPLNVHVNDDLRRSDPVAWPIHHACQNVLRRRNRALHVRKRREANVLSVGAERVFPAENTSEYRREEILVKRGHLPDVRTISALRRLGYGGSARH